MAGAAPWPPGMLLTDGALDGAAPEGLTAGAGTGDTSTNEGGSPTVDGTAGGTGGGLDSLLSHGSLLGAPEIRGERGEEVTQKATASPGVGPCGEESAGALVAGLQASLRELLQEQHAACLARIDHGVSLQEDVLAHLRTIQQRLDGGSPSGRLHGGAACSSPHGASVWQCGSLDLPGSPSSQVARPTLAGLVQESSSGSCGGRAVEVAQAPPTPGKASRGPGSMCAVAPRASAAAFLRKRAPAASVTVSGPAAPKKKEVYVSDLDSQPSEVEDEEEQAVTEPKTREHSNTPQQNGHSSEPVDKDADAPPFQQFVNAAREKRGVSRKTLPLLPANLINMEKESVACGKRIRKSLNQVKERITVHSNRSSLIMPSRQTEADAKDDESLQRKSNFSSRLRSLQSFSILPRKANTVGTLDPRHTNEEDEEEDDDEEGRRDSDDSSEQPRTREKRKKGRRGGTNRFRQAGRDVRLGNMRERDGDFWLRLTKHPLFDFCSGILIVASTVIAGTETNYMAQNNGATTDSYYVVRMIFLACFAVELTLRMLGAGLRNFFLAKDRGWNIFDFIMVGASLFEVAVQVVQGSAEPGASGGGQGRILRILRIVRISRALRLGRVLRYARTFRQIVYSLQSSVMTLFWAMVMIFLVVYCFAVCFCQAWTEYIADPQAIAISPADHREMVLLYSSMGRSLYSLFMAMTGGRSWGELLKPLMDVSELYTVLFVLFVCLTYFGVLNVVAAIFVDSAMQSQQHYKDLLIQENVEKKEVYSQHLREVFHEIDRDGSGHINGDEMEFFLADPSLNLYLESIDIFPNDARSLFRLLDRDGSGEVSIDEFCQGCLRLKGEAKSFDIHCLIYANDRSQRKLDQILNWLIQAVEPEGA